MQEKATAIETALLFFELEWAALDDDRAEELLATEGLDFARHHLRSARRYRPHLLSEPEERIFSERALTGRSAWTRLFEEQSSAITVELPDATEPVSLEVAMARLFSPDRELRRDTQSGSRPRSSRACARARSCSTRCWRTRWSRTGCATTRTGWPAATSPTRPPTSPSRRSSRPSARATSCRAAGTG